jgi:hypothetical protein
VLGVASAAVFARRHEGGIVEAATIGAQQHWQAHSCSRGFVVS